MTATHLTSCNLLQKMLQKDLSPIYWKILKIKKWYAAVLLQNPHVDLRLNTEAMRSKPDRHACCHTIRHIRAMSGVSKTYITRLLLVSCPSVPMHACQLTQSEIRHSYIIRCSIQETNRLTLRKKAFTVYTRLSQQQWLWMIAGHRLFATNILAGSYGIGVWPTNRYSWSRL